MTTTTYKGYTIRVTGLSHHIHRPGQDLTSYAPGYAQSMAAAKRWINEDIKRQTTIPQDEGTLGRYKRVS